MLFDKLAHRIGNVRHRVHDEFFQFHKNRQTPYDSAPTGVIITRNRLTTVHTAVRGPY